MKQRVRPARERGFSLTEVLVVTAVLVIVIAGTLLMYDRSNQIFKRSTEAAEMQQNVRIAYDRMIADVRMAGFDYKRAGRVSMQSNAISPWVSGRTYVAGAIVTPPTPNGHTYRAQDDGIAGGSVSWPASGTVVDNAGANSITWEENGAAIYDQPDEQIEFAGSTAITIRANLDYSLNETGDGDHGRETIMESGHFPVITTENEELVTYALVSTRTGSGINDNSVVFYADVNTSTEYAADGNKPSRKAYPSGRAERAVTITGIETSNDFPPYTLYRFTLNDQGDVVRTPLAENIRSLNFFYYEDPQGSRSLYDVTTPTAALAPSPGGDGAYDPATPTTISAVGRRIRQKIRAVRVRLVGMSSQTDANYADTSTMNGQLGSTDSVGVPTFVTDTVAPRYRRMALDTLIVPRNLGIMGMPQTTAQPPVAPTIESICFGYCGIAYVKWRTNTPNLIANYSVVWDTDPSGGYVNEVYAGVSSSWAVDLTAVPDLNRTFYFKIKAFNGAGSRLSATYMSANLRNATRPGAPLDFLASNPSVSGRPTDPQGRIKLQWTVNPANASGTGTISCSTGSAPSVNFLGETRGFRIWRSTNPASMPGDSDSTQLVNENSPTAIFPVQDGFGHYTWYDTAAAGCTTYYYRIQAVEHCANAATNNTAGGTATAVSDIVPPSGNGMDGRTVTTAMPAAPRTIALNTDATLTFCDDPTNTCTVAIDFQPVTEDVNGATIAIDEYSVQRQRYLNNGTIDGSAGSLVNIPMTNALAQTGSRIRFTDTTATYKASSGLQYRYKYRIAAMQPTPCVDSTLYSAWVDFPPPCTFTGTAVVSSDASGNGETEDTAWELGPTTDTITVSAPVTETLTQITVEVFDADENSLWTETRTSAPATFNWRYATPGELYRLVFTMKNNATPPCIEQLERYVIQEDPPAACSLGTGTVVTGTGNRLNITIPNTNTLTGQGLIIKGVTFTWASNRTWSTLQFGSGGPTTAGGGSGSGTLTTTTDLDPLPAGFTTANVTIPPGGNIQLFAQFSGNLNSTSISGICVEYERADFPGLRYTCSTLPAPVSGADPFNAPCD